MFLHGIGKNRLTALRISLMKNGLQLRFLKRIKVQSSLETFFFTLRVHGNTHRQPSKAFSAEDVQQVVSFITNYAEDHAILLPGRIPGYKRSDIQLLPSNKTKMAVWSAYAAATEHLPMKVAGYRAFCMIWKQFVPNIIVTKPASDLCWVCQRNSTMIMILANKTEEEKSTVSMHYAVTANRVHVDIHVHLYL